MMRPEDIKNRTFANALRGYDRDEVRSFLGRVAESTQELHDQLSATEARLAETATEAAPSSVVHDALEASTSMSGTDTDLDAVERAIVDRYGALGDRIAELLRHADESAAAMVAAAENDSEAIRATAAAEAEQVRFDAEQQAAELLSEARTIRNEIDAYRDEVMAELESARSEQESALAEAKAAAEADIETFRVDSISEIETLRSEARTEVEELRGSATAEVDELRTTAQLEVEQLREAAIAEGQAAIAEHEAEAARLRDEADNDRRTARAELDDVRSEVSSLLEQARTQSEFIKQEADEIIRTKVRANFEQAQARLDVLRNTEIASRERIVRAQTELSSALTRLDAEPAPELDPNSAPAVIEEAERRQGELGGQPDQPFGTDVVEVDEVDRSTFEADVAEANQQIDAEGARSSPLAPFLDEHPEPGDVDAGDTPDEPGFAVAAYDAPDDHDVIEATGHPVTEHVVEATDDDSTETDSAVDRADDPASDPETGPLGDASAAHSSPPGTSAVGGPAEEDALARLVREAMQEAVDSARKND